MHPVAIERRLAPPSAKQKVDVLREYIEILRQHNAPPAVLTVAEQALEAAEAELRRELEPAARVAG
jgi:hypothetical protein